MNSQHGELWCSSVHRLFAACILSFAKILSGVNAFEINNLQEQETESRYPGDPDVTSYHERDQAPSSNVAHQIGLVSRHERFVPQC